MRAMSNGRVRTSLIAFSIRIEACLAYTSSNDYQLVARVSNDSTRPRNPESSLTNITG